MSTSIIHWTFKDLRKQFTTYLPDIRRAAEESASVNEFKLAVKEICPNNTIAQLIEFDGCTTTDFSTGESINIQTITLLYNFLNTKNAINPATEKTENDIASLDLLTDLYFIFCNAYNKENNNQHPDAIHNNSLSCSANKGEPDNKPDNLLTGEAPKTEPGNPVTEAKISNWIKRWPSGTNPVIQQAREESKQRIIRKLIHRIERRYSTSTQYNFQESLSFEEKQQKVEEWWNSHRFQLHMAIKSPDELNSFLDKTLPEETMQILHDAKKKGIPFFITPYYLSLLDITGEAYDDMSLRSYILYTKELVDTFGDIKAWEKEDEVESGKANAAGWILPEEGRNIHRRYPDVAIFIPDSRGRACGGLCASCQRMYDFQSKRLNFDLKELVPKESWPAKLKKLMAYFEEDTQLQDILITGGDALMSRNATLRNIFEAVYKMALQKKIANENRADGEKFAEIQRVRLGTRLPAYLPMRIDDELITILKEFREKASRIGIKQFFVQTHFQTPLEMTKEAKEAIQRITSAGWIITNQLVYNVATSRRGHTVALRRTLIKNGVVPYYTFTVKGFHENYAVYAPIARAMQERTEEKTFGTLNREQQEQFAEILQNNIPYTKEINKFLQNNKYMFVATDRSVLNLPGIGKSMTFNLIGITKEGKRILNFEHDTTRRHSPAIKAFGEIHITENKSILAYLRQLEQLGEDPKSYRSIWGYTEGKTEPKFKLYEYPAFPFIATEEVNHIM